MRNRLRQGAAGDLLAVFGTFLVLGVVCGVLWWLLVDPAAYTKTVDSRGVMGELDLAKEFNADGWYASIAIVAGFLSGLVVTWWRSRDFRVTTILLVPGAVIAAAAMALVGWALGPGNTTVALAAAHRGQAVPVQLMVTALRPGHALWPPSPVYLVWPVAVLFGALMVLWSSPGVPSSDPVADTEDKEDQSDWNSAEKSGRTGL